MVNYLRSNYEFLWRKLLSTYWSQTPATIHIPSYDCATDVKKTHWWAAMVLNNDRRMVPIHWWVIPLYVELQILANGHELAMACDNIGINSRTAIKNGIQKILFQWYHENAQECDMMHCDEQLISWLSHIWSSRSNSVQAMMSCK